MFLLVWNDAAGAQRIDFGRAKSELLENLLVVLAEPRSALCRRLGDAVHLDRAADRRRQLAAGALERNDDVIGPELRIVYHLLWIAHDAEGDVHAAEDFVPMRHRLCAEDLVEDGGELSHV